MLPRIIAATLLGVLASLSLPTGTARGEILAMVNYETKPAQTFKKEGIAIIDVDPKSANFGKILVDMPLPHDLHNHHIFYNKDASKAYITVFGENALYVMDLKRFPYRTTVVSVPDCGVGEDIVFSDDNSRWYLTCMGSSVVVIGDAVSDKPLKTVKTPKPYPHGIALHDGIDRILITGTVKHDLTDPGETITVLEASTGKPLNSHKLSDKPSPSGVAPVEILFVPRSNPPVAYVTNMFGGTLWAAQWDPARKDFDVSQVFDFNSIKAGIPLEMYFNPKADRLYVTTANPGNFHIFDISAGATKPKLLKTIPTAQGAHHVGFTKDGRYAFVQTNLLNLPGMDDGSIAVIDLKSEEVVNTINTFKDQGLNPNLIVLLPEWNDPAGH